MRLSRLEELQPSELQRLLTHPAIGPAQQDRIRQLLGQAPPAAPVSLPPLVLLPIWGAAPAAPDKPQRQARRGVPNLTESRFSRDVLGPLQAKGGLVRHEFEATTWHVHGFAKYTPDWTCTLPDLSLWLVEIKGGVIHEASRLRYRGHAMARPWHRWTMVQWDRKAKTWRVVHDSQGKGL